MQAKGQNPRAGGGVGGIGEGEEREMESLRLILCRPKEHRLLFSGPKSQDSLKAPLSSSLSWRCGLGWRNSAPNKQIGRPALPFFSSGSHSGSVCGP